VFDALQVGCFMGLMMKSHNTKADVAEDGAAQRQQRTSQS
jgi:hypothetical protein